MNKASTVFLMTYLWLFLSCPLQAQVQTGAAPTIEGAHAFLKDYLWRLGDDGPFYTGSGCKSVVTSFVEGRANGMTTNVMYEKHLDWNEIQEASKRFEDIPGLLHASIELSGKIPVYRRGKYKRDDTHYMMFFQNNITRDRAYKAVTFILKSCSQPSKYGF